MPSDKDPAKHCTRNDAWVTYEGKVLDVSGFLSAHPGGDSTILPYLGNDITEAFKNAGHSAAAEAMIDGLVLGEPSEKAQKVDPYKGTLYQVWTRLDLKSYVAFVNSPKSVEGHMRVFDSPFLEIFSMTPWQLIPVFWIPVITYFFIRSFTQVGYLAVLIFVIGLAYWTLFEYLFHRFAFHSETYLPDNNNVLCLHYLIHGIHHAFPMDSLRLVFPPILGVFFAVLTKQLMYNPLLPLSIADSLFAGKISGYIWYDLFHYFSHHAKAKSGYFKFMKSYHLAHHYKDPYRGFGVSNHFWDVVFGTELELTKHNS